MRASSHPAIVCAVSMCSLLMFASVSPAQVAGAPPPAAGTHLVEPAALAKLLPMPEGWARGEVRLNQFENASGCNYNVASVLYTQDAMQVRVTLADTGAHPEGLMAVAAPIVMLEENHDSKVEPATTIKRMKIGGWPAAEIMNGEKMTGELTLVVGGRFVVAIEARNVASLDPLRAMLAAVDLKALAAQK